MTKDPMTQQPAPEAVSSEGEAWPVLKFAIGDVVRLTRQGHVEIVISSITARSDEPRYYGRPKGGGAAFGAYEGECVLVASHTPGQPDSRSGAGPHYCNVCKGYVPTFAGARPAIVHKWCECEYMAPAGTHSDQPQQPDTLDFDDAGRVELDADHPLARQFQKDTKALSDDRRDKTVAAAPDMSQLLTGAPDALAEGLEVVGWRHRFITPSAGKWTVQKNKAHWYRGDDDVEIEPLTSHAEATRQIEALREIVRDGIIVFPDTKWAEAARDLLPGGSPK